MTDEEEELPIDLPRVPQLAALMRKTLTQTLPDDARREIAFELQKWRATRRNGRQVIGVLNGRYDLWVFGCASPAPWIAAGFDTKEGVLVLAELLPRNPITVQDCAAYVARAVGETITSVVSHIGTGTAPP